MSDTKEKETPDPNKMPVEDLGDMIDKIAADTLQEADDTWTEPDATTEPEFVPGQDPETDPETEPESAAAEAVAPDPSVVAKAMADERAALLSDKYEQLQKHSARLAGEIGDLRRKLTQRERVDFVQEDERSVAPELEERFQRLEARANKEAVQRATQEEFARFDARPDIAALGLGAELQRVAPKYKERVEAIQQLDDPDEARITARDIATSVIADAIADRLATSATRAKETAVTAPTRQAEKRASATTSTSGGTRVAKPRQISDPLTMPIADLKRMIEANRPE